MKRAEWIARAFHETYERLAPEHSYETRAESRVPWEDVPEENRSLMIAVVQELLDTRILGTGHDAPGDPIWERDVSDPGDKLPPSPPPRAPR